MEERFISDPQTKIHLKFLNFLELMNFCIYCTRRNISATTEPDTLGAVMSRESFERLPKSFRDTFETQDAETSRKILLGTKKSAPIARPAARSTDQHQTDEKKLIDWLLPPALMPRVE